MKKKLSNSPHDSTASQETASESWWLDFAFGLNDVTCDYRSLGFDEAQLI